MLSDNGYVREVLVDRGRTVEVTWEPGRFPPSGASIRQVYGLCLTSERLLLLVSKDGVSWTLPGGRPEPGESHEGTLAREVMEEACAVVTGCRYVGAQRVADHAHDYYQLRYIADVELLPFEPQHEMRFRRCVTLADARALLWNGTSAIGNALIDLIPDVDQ